MAAERLQKILAAAGHGSRRACEDIVVAGRVRVNGHTATLGEKADPAVDQITLDGEPVRAEKPVYLALNKPRGIVSSLEPQGERRTVRDLVPLSERLYPVGRLDIQSEGLILLTNDGELTNRLTHPRYGHEKEYRVRVIGRVDGSLIETWRRGVVILDEEGNSERTLPAEVEVESQQKDGSETYLKVIMREGKKHQIRRVAETLGLRVTRLVRVRMGPLRLGRLKLGEWRSLTKDEVETLMAVGSKQVRKESRQRRTGGLPAPRRPGRRAPAKAARERKSEETGRQRKQR